jgi:hypothetical protein
VRGAPAAAVELQALGGVGIVLPMGSIKRACLRLGVAATVSLVCALAIMLFLVEAPQVGTWFLASAALAAASFLTAVIAAHFEQ